jgi:DNA replication initiation complex subunit (GINS family)
MNLDDLKVIRNEERRSRQLTVLKNDFYPEFKEYVNSLKNSDDPQKKDELENALRVADAIYDKRAAKIIKLAALAAKGHKEDASLADAEAQIYDAVYSVFTNYRDCLLAQKESIEAGHPRSTADLQADENHRVARPLLEEDSFRANLDDTSVKQPHGGKGSQRLIDFNEDAQENTDVNEARHDERTLIREHENMRYLQVRVLTDIPTFIGLDGENYKLGEGETALLPEGNAQALSDRHIAIIVGDKLEDAKEGQVDMSGVQETHHSRS